MKHLIYLILLLTTVDSLSQTRFYYCLERDMFTKTTVALVYQFEADSVKFYIPEAGYLWWDIVEKKDVADKKGYRLLDKGEFVLRRKNAESLLIVTPSRIYQVVTIKPDNVSFSIECENKHGSL